MKIYYYGRKEEIIALTDGLLALEFYPENLQKHPILRADEASIFWNPEVGGEGDGVVCWVVLIFFLMFFSFIFREKNNTN